MKRAPELIDLGERDVVLDTGVRVRTRVILAEAAHMPHPAMHVATSEDDGAGGERTIVNAYISTDQWPETHDQLVFHEATEWYWIDQISRNGAFFRDLLATLGAPEPDALHRILSTPDAALDPNDANVVFQNLRRVDVDNAIGLFDRCREGSLRIQLGFPEMSSTELTGIVQALMFTRREALRQILTGAIDDQRIRFLATAHERRRGVVRVLLRYLKLHRQNRCAHIIASALDGLKFTDETMSPFLRWSLETASIHILRTVVEEEPPEVRAKLHHRVLQVANHHGAANIDITAVAALELRVWLAARDMLTRAAGR